MNLNPALLAVLLAPLGLILVDAVLGIAIAVKGGKFDIAKLPNVLSNLAAPFVVVGGGVVLNAILAGPAAGGIAAVATALAAAESARALADIKDKSSALLGGNS